MTILSLLETSYVAALMFLLLRLLRVARATFGLAQRANRRVAMDLLMTRQARLHGRRLLSVIERCGEIEATAIDGWQPKT